MIGILCFFCTGRKAILWGIIQEESAFGEDV
jgi:hypothetical protein